MEEFQVKINRAPHRFGTDMVLFRKTESGANIITNVVTNMEVISVDAGELIEDEAVIPIADAAVVEIANFAIREGYIKVEKPDVLVSENKMLKDENRFLRTLLSDLIESRRD